MAEAFSVRGKVCVITGAFHGLGEVIARRGALGPFEQGLFAATEMLIDAFQHLWEADIPSDYVIFPGVDYFMTATDGETTSSTPSWRP